MIRAVSANRITQDLVTDCSFVASLCITAAYEQRFRKHATMKEHIESVAHAGSCLDHNMGSGELDLYSCCMSPACAEKNEEWSLTRSGSRNGDLLVSATNGECVTEDSLELGGGSGVFSSIGQFVAKQCGISTFADSHCLVQTQQ